MPLDVAAFLASVKATPPPAAPPPPAAVNPLGLDQSELIGFRELTDLVTVLARRKSEKHQQIGRAIAKALRGEPFCAPREGRNATLFQIAGEIIEKYPYADPEPIANHFTISLERLAEESAAAGMPASNPSPSRSEFVSMLQRHQGPKQHKYQAAQAIEGVYQSALDLLPKVSQAEAVTWDLPPEAVDAAPQTSAAGNAGLDYRSIIVRVDDGCYYLRHPQAKTYQIVCNGKEALRLELQRMVLDLGGLGMQLTDDAGDMLENDKILRAYGMNARSTIYDYAATETEFDPATCALRKGYVQGRLADNTAIGPEVSDRVERWLLELAGGLEPDLLELYDWIASTDQRWVRTNAAALVIVGAPGVGKTVFARALAHTWGETAPVKFGYVVDRFNGALTRCPIWFADEEMPDGITDAMFREIVQEEQRDVEFKGQERMVLRGTSRILIGLNQIEDLKIHSSSGPDGARAVADRLAIYNASGETKTKAALLKISGDNRQAQRLEIARHLRWVQVNITPREQRFLGARGDTSAALTPILEASAQGCPRIFDALREYFLDPIAWEREYTPSALISMPGRRYPIVCGIETWGAGFIYVNLAELCERCGIPERDRRFARAALRPFQNAGEPIWQSFGAKGGRYRAQYLSLDPDRLDSVLSVDTIPAFVPGTRARIST